MAVVVALAAGLRQRIRTETDSTSCVDDLVYLTILGLLGEFVAFLFRRRGVAEKLEARAGGNRVSHRSHLFEDELQLCQTGCPEVRAKMRQEGVFLRRSAILPGIGSTSLPGST